MLEPTHYIYRHIRPDTNKVFYVGMGTYRRRYSTERSRDKQSRNRFWKNVVKKNSGKYDIEIMMEFDNIKECFKKEIEFIKLYGRKNLGLGTLTNLTDGGDGAHNTVVSDETKKILSEMFSGVNHPNYGKKLSAETCKRKSEALMGAKHHLYGQKLPDEWKNNIRKSKIGKDNPMYGKTGALHPASKIVINISTKEKYQSITEAANKNGLKMKTLANMLSGMRKNNTNLRYL